MSLSRLIHMAPAPTPPAPEGVGSPILSLPNPLSRGEPRHSRQNTNWNTVDDEPTSPAADAISRPMFPVACAGNQRPLGKPARYLVSRKWMSGQTMAAIPGLRYPRQKLQPASIGWAHRHPHISAPTACNWVDLPNGSRHIAGFGMVMALHRNRCITAYPETKPTRICRGHPTFDGGLLMHVPFHLTGRRRRRNTARAVMTCISTAGPRKLNLRYRFHGAESPDHRTIVIEFSDMPLPCIRTAMQAPDRQTSGYL